MRLHLIQAWIRSSQVIIGVLGTVCGWLIELKNEVYVIKGECVSQKEWVNLSSLNLVSDELVAAIEHTASKLEQYVVSPQAYDLMEECIAGIKQVRGTFRLIQLGGAEMLADEILAVAEEIDIENKPLLESTLGHLTNAFFILPRYLEYTQQTRRALPVLLIPYINELRQITKRPLISEAEFFSVNLDASYPAQTRVSALAIEDLDALLKRLRHMYQVGLLNLLQGKPARSALGIMQRALERLEIISGDKAKSALWGLGSAALEVLRVNNMEINKSRKMLLTALDRQIKSLQAQGLSGLDQAAPDSVLKQLLFILVLAHKPTSKASRILEAYAVASPGYNDQDLRNERETLRGPSFSTVSSVAAVIKDEVRDIKELLERVAEAGQVDKDEYQELISSLAKVADILSVVGLVAASNSLKESVSKVESWMQTGQHPDKTEMIDIADALLYVESTVSSLENLSLTSDKLAQINHLARKEVIASTQLAEAEMLVIQEAEAGLSLVKRGLNTFAESNFDDGHIKNICATLNGVRGGMIVLGLNKAAAVVKSCIEFVDQTLLTNKQPVALQQLLETFADAVIGLEYYLDALKNDKNADESILSIAEESLQALGHRVVV